MKNKKLFIGAIIVSLLVIAVPTVTNAENQLLDNNARATQETYILESSHPYSNNYDHTWTITKPGATSIKVHFTYIEVETNYDYLYVYDYAGNTLHKLTGTYSSGGWSAVSNGDTIKIRLVTDYSVTKWGFKIDLIEYEGGSGGSTGGGALNNGQTVTSSLSATGDSEMWYIDVDANAISMHSVLTCGSADFDLYGRLGAEPTTSTYNWRGYTYGGEDVTYDNPGEGRWYIMVHSYSGSGAYDLTVTVEYSSGGSTGDGVTNYYAVIVGISDYEVISDLSYCDEDATDWYNFLTGTLGWSSTNIRVYGDTNSGNYPIYTGLATEFNVKQALNWLVGTADADDVIAYISSGHGSGDGSGSSYLCMWDCNSGENGEDGSLYDTELAAILDDAVAEKIFVFLDHCFSGGFGDNLMNMPNKSNVYLTTTCTENGYGYDDPTHNNGAWTYYFLEYSWINYYGGSSSTALETIFSYALNAYPHSGGDTPQQFDGNTGAYFYLN
ncbi:MAG: caspase family protein [Candidatus Heimdallarchaeum endolithica]|uniref:Caspase family protein n=1 Tax=Candidatus Heimdallarchaeum endolithica TaxID=2876572 RepID=A0A9Y1BS56_9ARCH|nr:MAG: caspase family protein [Candidatus Heimdallarchaeum endolithica]